MESQVVLAVEQDGAIIHPRPPEQLAQEQPTKEKPGVQQQPQLATGRELAVVALEVLAIQTQGRLTLVLQVGLD
jgi:hypothetical protein